MSPEAANYFSKVVLVALVFNVWWYLFGDGLFIVSMIVTPVVLFGLYNFLVNTKV